jgi:phage shock protein PspC (stress-responsive transcriptional regulator)
MFRSWEQRLISGVCGGLAELTRLNAWLWRGAFVALTLAMAGWGVAVYVAVGWLSPLKLPLNPRRVQPLRLLITLIVVAVLIGGYALQGREGVPPYAPLVAFVLAGVFFLREATGKNALLGAVALAFTGLWLAGAVGAVPESVTDWQARVAGALAFFLGLSLLLRDRFRFSGVFALSLTVALTAGLAAAAYGARLNTPRDDLRADHSHALNAQITTLQVNVATLDTDVQFFSAPVGVREVRATYRGSNASALNVQYEESDAIATFTFQEARPSALPKLNDVGRATLTVELPQEVGVFIAFASQNGTANLDLRGVNLEWVNMELVRGSAVVAFPPYQPLSEDVRSRQGELRVLDGNLRLLLAPEIGVQFLVNKATNARPLADDLLYALEDNINDWRLVSRQFNTLAVQIRYILTVPRGEIRLDNNVSGR